MGIQFRDALKEQTIAGHCVIDARAGQYQSVIATEGRNHDRQRHQNRTARSEYHLHGSRGDPTLRRRLYGVKRQRHHISQVRQQVQPDYDSATD